MATLIVPLILRSHSTQLIQIKIGNVLLRSQNPIGLFLRRNIVKVTEKLNVGRIEKLKQYWISLGIDYREAILDIIKECKRKPGKALIYSSGLLGLGYAVKESPDDLEYKDRLLRHLNESALLGSKIRNSEVDEHFKYVVDCYNEGIVRRTSFGIGSILWVDNYHPQCAIYEATTSFLKPQFLTFYERIFDIGFCGHWWNLRKKFENFDINVNEWN